MSDMNSSELYDRQTRTYGKESIEKFNSGNVYIFGIERGLGPEVIKNIALTGIKNINIFNDFNVTKSDIEDSYFYKDSDLNKVKTDVIIDYIKDLLNDLLLFLTHATFLLRKHKPTNRT